MDTKNYRLVLGQMRVAWIYDADFFETGRQAQIMLINPMQKVKNRMHCQIRGLSGDVCLKNEN